MDKNLKTYVYYYNSPCGELSIVSDGKNITEIEFGHREIKDVEIKEIEVIKKAHQQLEEYFAGKRKNFDLPLNPKGTEFQCKVWLALREIPYGETRSYKQIAEAAGCPKGCRAVGMANNRNPISIVVPCHRVIGADGKLVGYGGGLDNKEKLLNLEAK